MREVEYFKWWVTGPSRKSPYLTRFAMDAATAEKQYPGARPEPSTREVRQMPDSPEEEREAMANYPSAGHDGVRK